MTRELRTTLVIMAVVLIVASPAIFAEPQAQPTTSYLALVFQLHPSPTPTPIPVKQIENGGFELGSDSWYTFGPVAFLDAPGLAHSGQRMASIGGTQKRITYFSQRVDVTAEAPYLVYWHALRSDEYKCTYDYAYVRVDLLGTVDSVDTFCNTPNQTPWRRRVIDLRRAIGYNADILFIISTDVALASYWRIDDVSMQPTP